MGYYVPLKKFNVQHLIHLLKNYMNRLLVSTRNNFQVLKLKLSLANSPINNNNHKTKTTKYKKLDAKVASPTPNASNSNNVSHGQKNIKK